MSAPLLERVEDGVATLTFNAPLKRNALSMEMRAALYAAVDRVAADADLRCVVLTGAGGHFMAGGDISSFGEMLKLDRAEREARFLDRTAALARMVETLMTMPKPVVAVARGAVAGAGLSILLACDLALADESAFVSMAYRGVGACPDGGGSWLLPHVVGRRRAMEITLLSERIDAQEAARLGIFNRVAAADALEDVAATTIRSLSRGPTEALAATKRLLHRAPEQSLSAHLRAEGAAFARLTTSADWEEGVRAFLERRKPVFGQG